MKSQTYTKTYAKWRKLNKFEKCVKKGLQKNGKCQKQVENEAGEPQDPFQSKRHAK